MIGGRKPKPLTAEAIATVLELKEKGTGIGIIAKKIGVGTDRIYTILEDNGYSRTSQKDKKKIGIREVDARTAMNTAKKHWDSFEIGHVIQAMVKEERRKTLVTGKIIDKKEHYMEIVSRERRFTISFADVLTMNIKIRHRFKQKRGNFKVLCEK